MVELGCELGRCGDSLRNAFLLPTVHYHGACNDGLFDSVFDRGRGAYLLADSRLDNSVNHLRYRMGRTIYRSPYRRQEAQLSQGFTIPLNRPSLVDGVCVSFSWTPLLIVETTSDSNTRTNVPVICVEVMPALCFYVDIDCCRSA